MAEGDSAFEPRSRRPHTSPTRLVQSIRHLRAAGLITPTPKKRPKSSYVRFAAAQPNERWQADFTHWWLADNAHTEILCWIDDHARYALSVTAHRRVTGPTVLVTFRKAVEQHGIPASTLTDNGMVFTTRFAGGKGGRNHLEAELRRLGIVQINSSPNHPTTCGKVERFHQTLKRWLISQPRAATLADLQAQLDAFVDEYNHRRPHRSLPHQTTPATGYTARPKAIPGERDDTHNRVRRDRVDDTGSLTLRIAGRLHHIGVGRTHARTHVLVLIQDLNIRIIHAATGELLRQLTLDTTTDPQPTGAPEGPKRKRPEPNAGSGLFRCLETSHW
jgi:transposase InsO family protein